MGIDAIAVLGVPYTRVCEASGLTPAADPKRAIEETPPFVPIGGDATAAFLGVPFSSEPEELAMFAAHTFGPALAAHEDARGVLIVPSSVWGDGAFASYEATIEHFGEAGQWVAKLDAAAMAELADAQLQAMMGGAPGGPLAQGIEAQLGAFQDMLTSNPAAAQAAQSMAAQLAQGGGGMEGLLQAAQAMLTQMSPEQRAELEKMAHAALGHLPGDDDDDDSK